MRKPSEEHLMSFEELAALQKQIIAKQTTLTYEQALEQIKRLQKRSSVKEEYKKRYFYTKNR